MKFIITNKNKLNSIEVISGQLIFVKDERVIYLDSDTRTRFSQMIYLLTENARINLSNPLEGFYFVEETAVLWHYSISKGWEQLTNTPNEKIVFDNLENFPNPGQTGVLYCDPAAIYQWNVEKNSYIPMGMGVWKQIV